MPAAGHGVVVVYESDDGVWTLVGKQVARVGDQVERYAGEHPRDGAGQRTRWEERVVAARNDHARRAGRTATCRRRDGGGRQ